MIIYKCAFSGDELISDVYDLKEKHGALWEADCAMITIKKGADVDIGANASAEEAADDLEEGSETVNNVVHSFRLQSTNFDKKSYLTHIKSYMKQVLAHLTAKGASDEEKKAFQTGAQAAVKDITANFKDWEFYTGESGGIVDTADGKTQEAMVVLLNYREDGTTPYMVFWKHGLKEEKV